MYFGWMLDQELLTMSFDTTYKLNKFEMPVAASVGVNHHRRSCLFGCALLGNEDIESFEWLMQTFVKCIGKRPDGILTDQCGDMAIAIQNVMPNTRHRLCIWHIMKKIPHKLGRLPFESLSYNEQDYLGVSFTRII
ncbi:hypothetical protein Ahy_B07g086294 [Arachis hypogaea]|uniref:MULE transposase domain-containing protein n=1 Tax=Arachis hypogaea TaxID=3818 RepID=A0A444Y9J0_ARAHY|nr:hypothetical protein Ahy_B07g086294 [Arachis hypogaea]